MFNILPKSIQDTGDVNDVSLPPSGKDFKKSRKIRRKLNKRLTHDCVHTRVRENRVFCKRGKSIGEGSNSMPWTSVLYGKTPIICLECPMFIKRKV